MDQQTFELLAGFAHEVRTPLGAISGYAELLRLGAHGPLSETQVDLCGRILQHQRRLAGLVEDMMEYAALLANTEPVPVTRVPVITLLQAMRAGTPDAPVDWQATVRVVVDGTTLPDVVTHAPSCAQVLHTLVRDACDHAAGQPVTVSAQVDDALVTIVVATLAETISPAGASTLFVPFRSGTRATDAHPLALARARVLARQVGGDVCAVTDVSQRTVALALPRAPRPV